MSVFTLVFMYVCLLVCVCVLLLTKANIGD